MNRSKNNSIVAFIIAILLMVCSLPTEWMVISNVSVTSGGFPSGFPGGFTNFGHMTFVSFGIGIGLFSSEASLSIGGFLAFFGLAIGLWNTLLNSSRSSRMYQ
jgi:hypothetical protein